MSYKAGPFDSLKAMGRSRCISLSFAVVFVVFAICSLPAYFAAGSIIYILFATAVIWYGDELAAFASGWRLNAPTPGIMVKLAGWILLLLTPLVLHGARLRLELGF